MKGSVVLACAVQEGIGLKTHESDSSLLNLRYDFTSKQEPHMLSTHKPKRWVRVEVRSRTWDLVHGEAIELTMRPQLRTAKSFGF